MGGRRQPGASHEPGLAINARRRTRQRPRRVRMHHRDRRDGVPAVDCSAAQAPSRGGGVVTAPEVVFDEVSKFYGEVLGVNRLTLRIPSGITSLVGPNGSGKTTLMNLMTGLIHPDHGRILMRGISPRDPEALMRITGYATQYDTAP